MATATRPGEEAPSTVEQMTEAEALMWNVEKDPWFSSTIGTLIICDRPLDVERFTRKVTAAVADLPRLRARVVPRGGVAPPLWRTDPEFELGYHLRHQSLPRPGTRHQLLELTTRILQDPFDRTRPLWQFVVIEGLEDGRGALVIKLHHAVTDGAGGVQLAARYMDEERAATSPPEIDLDKLFAGILAAEGHRDHDVGGITALGGLALQTAGQAARWPVGALRKLAGDAVLACADPARVPEIAGEVGAAVRTVLTQLSPSDADARSPLWRERSRKRHLEVLDLPFGAAKDAAKRLGGSINDLFVSGAVAGARRYHEAENTPLERLTITFVVSTRDEPGETGNAFTPSKVVVPAGAAGPAARFCAIRDVLAARRREVTGAGLLAGVAGVANLLPASLTTRLARSAAAGVDFATSNVRATPVEVYTAGAKVLACYPIGPVAGTAWNVTLLSYAGQLNLGLHIDPVAVPNVPLLVASLRDAYDELLHASP